MGAAASHSFLVDLPYTIPKVVLSMGSATSRSACRRTAATAALSASCRIARVAVSTWLGLGLGLGLG